MTEISVDFFICHAFEDKEAVARPLYRELGRRGFQVWLDEVELTIGDSLRSKIDEGLRSCQFGIVILSRAFFSKKWPQFELDGLVTRQMQGTKVILPVWHGVNEAEVADYSPSLAGYYAVHAESGIEAVADAVSRAVQVQRAETTNIGGAGSLQRSLRDSRNQRKPSSSTTHSSDERRKALLNDRPAGWEYRLFASYLTDGVARLEDRYVAFELGVVHPVGRRLGVDELREVLQSEVDNAREIILNINRLFDQRFIVTVFGEPGQPGNPERIKFFGHELARVYDDMLRMCERVRSINTSEEYRHLVHLQSRLLGSPIQQLRDYVARWQALAEDMPRLVQQARQSGTPVNVEEMKLTLTIDKQLTQELKAEWENLRNTKHRG